MTSNLDHLVPSVYATMHVLCLLTLIVLQKLWGCTYANGHSSAFLEFNSPDANST